MLESIAFNAHLGMRLIRLNKDGVTIGCRIRPELLNGAGVLHGGVTATLADVAVGMALACHFGRLGVATTVEMKINYLRPVAAGKITARGRLLKIGSALAVGSVDLRDNQNRPAGAALVTYMLLNPPRP